MRKGRFRFSALHVSRGAFRGLGLGRSGRLGAMVQGRCGDRGFVSMGFGSERDRRRTSASRAAIYLTSPSSATLRFTSSVNATGEKTARDPDCSRTVYIVSEGALDSYGVLCTDCSSSADLYSAKSEEWNGECGDGSRHNIANDHHLIRIRGD